MTKVKVAFEYCDYLVEKIVAADSEAVNALDLTAQTEHFYSSGWAEPILSAGMGDLYRVTELEIPDWLVAGIERGQADGRWEGMPALLVAARVVNYDYSSEGWVGAIYKLATKSDKLNKFERSLADWFVAHGRLTDKQAACVFNPRYG